jgi:hypothetical protein
VAKRNNSEKDSSRDSSKNAKSSRSDISMLARLLGPFKILLKMHLKMAAKEFKKDSGRLISGIVSLLIGVFLIIIFLILLNAVIIFALNEFTNLKVFYCILIVTGANLLIAILMLTSAISSFKKPFLKETKKVLKETLEDLKIK